MFDKLISKAKVLSKAASLKLEKHAPEFLVGTALIAGACAIYSACKATHDDLDDILTQAEKELQVIVTQENDGILPPKEAFKQRAEVKLETAGKLARAYAPAAILAAISAGSTIGANRILSKRNVALLASYAALDKYTRDYQKRVMNTVGEEVERKIRYDIRDDMREVEMVDPDTGNTETVREKTGVEKAHVYDRFDFMFDERSPRYQNNPDYDETFVYLVQEQANKILECRRSDTKAGYYFLDELLDDFGLDPDDVGISFEEAHIVGWYLPPKNELGVAPGDIHHIDLGIGKYVDLTKKNMTEEEDIDGILIIPNVDGVVYHLI